ncbi:MAG: DUF1566 domain-containing protein [Prevotella sp.]|nr:DUF1566 domain-containing protein [Prevotella sp.]
MKAAKLFMIAALAIALPYTFISCSSDDDDYEIKNEIVDDEQNNNKQTDEEQVSSASGKINGYEYVDLGLSVLWATCNVGASSPSDYGDYYAWGETTTKNTYTKNNSTTYGKSMNDISGNSTYDAAYANWGSSWRMPTSDEIDELMNKCNWEWTTIDNHNGYIVTGPNGNSIFLPAAGMYDGSSLQYEGYFSYYWSSTPYESNTNGAYQLAFYSGDFERNWCNRYYGQSVRPVSGQNSNKQTDDEQLSSASGTINGYEYVDLGLDVMWATCNVGASSPSDYGDYYAWGEITTKDTYTRNNCATYEKDMVDISGNSTYDAATANWGGTWRMPTSDEVEQLIEKCDCEWTTINGHAGCKITGPNGNSIFLPAVGERYQDMLVDDGESGSYWSSTPNTLYYAYCFDVSENTGSIKGYSWQSRYIGRCVRPVSGQNNNGQNDDGQTDDEQLSSASGTINGYEYIDLGLSVKWATCNVGASSPSDYGDYYAWGETSTKSSYTQGTCSTFNKSMVDISGDSRYDAARVNWGGTWRMPTSDEMNELINKCNWSWTTMDDHYGFKVTGPNSNSIFLPATGYIDGSSLRYEGFAGYYWISTPKDGSTVNSYNLGFYSGDASISLSSRIYGETVRAVSD